MKHFRHVLTSDEISELARYEKTYDDRVFSYKRINRVSNLLPENSNTQPDTICKLPRWNVDQWPQHIIKKTLDYCIDYEYEITQVIFRRSRVSLYLHVDSGQTEQEHRGHAVLIPLYTNGPSHTVFFDNYWHGNSAKFSKGEQQSYEHGLLDKHGKWQYIPDARDLYNVCIENPESVQDFAVNQELILELETLIKERSDQSSSSKFNNRIYDYTNIVNYDPLIKFNIDLHAQYLSHIAIETLHGLTVETIAEWHPGDCFQWSCRQLHAAGSGHTEKVGITVFVQPIE